MDEYFYNSDLMHIEEEIEKYISENQNSISKNIDLENILHNRFKLRAERASLSELKQFDYAITSKRNEDIKNANECIFELYNELEKRERNKGNEIGSLKDINVPEDFKETANTLLQSKELSELQDSKNNDQNLQSIINEYDKLVTEAVDNVDHVKKRQLYVEFEEKAKDYFAKTSLTDLDDEMIQLGKLHKTTVFSLTVLDSPLFEERCENTQFDELRDFLHKKVNEDKEKMDDTEKEIGHNNEITASKSALLIRDNLCEYWMAQGKDFSDQNLYGVPVPYGYKETASKLMNNTYPNLQNLEEQRTR